MKEKEETLRLTSKIKLGDVVWPKFAQCDPESNSVVPIFDGIKTILRHLA